MAEEKLFTEFPPISTEQWEATINKDLKGADYEKKLVWRTDEGFNVRPYYRAENLKDIDYLNTLPAEFPYTRGAKADNNKWEIVQEIEEADPAKANAIALDALKRGATTIAVNAQQLDNANALATLLNNIDLNKTGVQFNHVKSYLDLMKLFLQYVEEKGYDKDSVSGSINFDPLTYRLRHNKFYFSQKEDMMQAVELLNMVEGMKNFKLINVNGIVLHNAGSTIVQELGYTLALANEYLAFCTENGIKPEKVASRMQLTLSVGSNYFMEIAKLRATRLLWSTIVAQYKPACDCAYKIRINTVASTWNKTLYDPYVNMLRSTTEGMSAVIGGSDAISLQPFDVAYKESDDFSRRIARNVQVILKEEAFMDRVVDPAAGSYYVETLTNAIAEHAWTLFQSVEANGGALKAIEDGSLQAEIEKSCQKRDMDIATRRYILLGTNQYPNINETMADKIEHLKKDDCEGLKTYRGAMAFEELRLDTEKYAKENHRPSVYLLKLGNLAMRQARAGFITNFFGCAGYKIVEPAGFATVEEGVKAAGEAKPDLIVVCSSDEEYATLGVEAAKQCKAQFPNTPFLVAGNPTECLDALKEAGTDDFIHVRVNILESLKKYNEMLLK
ncbi:MAG: acyl-CoA mutase large subunit family protein [Bacteroidales bacterium]|nr:acyl-CoA mutase large subunit family protein [Bacteroidales bacterium]MBR5922005.1 acyl-CoA mutase large subunit family protein [Bacteroidales bacterium]